MASDWQVMTLAEAVQINPQRPLAKGTEAPFVAMEDIIPSQRSVEVRQTRIFEGSGSRFMNGDTLFARITPCLENGKTAFISQLPKETVGHGSTEFIVMSGKENLSDNLFVYYLARDPNFRSYSAQQMEGTSGRQRVPVLALSKLVIELPPLPEQRAIAHILGALDDKIELNRRMNQTLEAMAQALFKSWFVDFEPFRDQGMQDSPLGEIPVGWRVGKLEEITVLHRETFNPGDYPDEVFDHYSIPAFDGSRMPKAETGDKIKSNKFRIPAGAVLISKLNPQFPRVWLPFDTGHHRSICSTEFLAVTPKGDSGREYLYSLFCSDSFFVMFSTLVTGTSSSHQRVRPEDLMSTELVIPPEEVVSSFSDKVRPLLILVNHNLAENGTLAGIRDALLPKLLSGEIRVKDAERFVEKAL
jgi:type I restriction enzyme S subunit